jgi:tetratricopeptide (TPR) repeat protein
MDYDRLRELQAKFDENPRRYFAPLANEYRKGGQPKRAIEICRAHLAQMPGHMSGQVVYGQALFEAAEFDEARQVFEGALVLDPENLIALRSLGDLALQAGNTEEARRWYSRLLEADPNDAAVVTLVAEIDAGDVTPATTAGERPGAERDTGEKHAPPPRETAASAPSPTDSEFTVDFSFVDQLPAAKAPASAVDGLKSQQPEPESPLAKVDSARAQTETPVSQADVPIGLERHYPPEDKVSPGSAAAESTTAAPESQPRSVAKETLPTAAPMGPDRDALDFPAVSSFAGTTPEPFVNETMAQLYLQQGYKQLALRVYRQLSEMRPNEQALKDRIAEIEASQAAEAEPPAARSRREEAPSIESPVGEPAGPRAPSIESPLPHGPASQPGSVEGPSIDRSPIDSPPTATPSREPDSIESPVREEPRAEPEGIAARQPSIREFFATLGRRRPARPAAASGSRGGGSTTPGDVPPSASLDAVFAGANVSATDARAASTLAGAFSASARGTTPPPPTSSPTPRANPRLQTQESEEDVAKFRAWLDGLTGE